MRPFLTHALPACSAALALLGGLGLPDASADAPGQATPTAILAKGTTVRVRLVASLTSGQCKTGDPVAFTVAEDVYGPSGVRLLAKGAAGVGHVTDSAGHHSLGRAGRLAFTCDSVSDGGLRIPLQLSVRPKPKTTPAPPPPVPPTPFPPTNDLHAPSPVVGDALANTPVGISGQITHSTTSPSYSMGSGPDVTAAAGEEFTASVAADTTVPVLPGPPLSVVALPPGAVKIDTDNVDQVLAGNDQDAALRRAVVESRLKAGFTVVQMPGGTLVMTPPAASPGPPTTLPAR